MPSCCKNSGYPSALEMAKDFSNTAMNAMRQALKTGEILASSDTIKKRLEICEKCPSKTGVRCRDCGCYLSLKTGIKAAECPLKKWAREP